MKLKQRFSKAGCKGRGRKAFWGIVLIAGIVALGSALAGGQRGEDGAFSAAGIAHVLDGLDASDEQREIIYALLERVEPEQRRLAAERDRLVRQLGEALAAAEPDAAEIGRLGDQASALAGQAVERSIEVAAELAAALTPDQRRRLVERWSERH